MTKKSVLTFFTLLCCLFFSELKSQEQNTATLPLATVLNNLEALFTFSKTIFVSAICIGFERKLRVNKQNIPTYYLQKHHNTPS